MTRPLIGIEQTFASPDESTLAQALGDLRRLQVRYLRLDVTRLPADELGALLSRLSADLHLTLVGPLDLIRPHLSPSLIEAVELPDHASVDEVAEVRSAGVKVVLGPDHPRLESADAVAINGVHVAQIAEVRSRVLTAEIWLTQVGFSTWQNDAWGQASHLARVLQTSADRIYWATLYDLHPDETTGTGFHRDPREYHCGLKTADAKPKTLFRIWADQGLDRVLSIDGSLTPHIQGSEPVTVITGGAGFVGTNVAAREIQLGRRVRIFDNLSRPGVEHNLKWLQETHGDRIELIVGDVRDRFALRYALQGARRVYHFAAQVAVTTSVDDPHHDFEINGIGTFNLLEELRRFESPPALLFTSTNKVYGDLGDLALRRTATRYEPEDEGIRNHGISERRTLDFHSPYGCSKGLADQYVLDYSRTYGLPTVVFRMSCIYGPHQFGNEDQGWVAHFLIKALKGQEITLFGDGKQVRDVLFVEDLVDAMSAAIEKIGLTTGYAFNMGGGVHNTTSLLELLQMIGEITGRQVEVQFSDWRVGDQRYYVSDTAAFAKMMDWRAKVSVREGVRRLADWLLQSSPLLAAQALPEVSHGRSISIH